jgi:YbbR domain-containing protein
MLQRLLHRDLLMRILAVLLALILWIQLTGEQVQTTQMTYDVPLAVRPAPAGYVNYDPVRETVQITVSGPRRVLERLKPSSFQAWVDLAVAAENRLTAAEVQVAPLGHEAVRLVAVTPDRIGVNLVKIEQEERPLVLLVQPTIKGDKRYSATTDVTKVTLAGPQSKLSAVKQVVLSVDYSAFSETTQVTLTPQALDAEGRPVSVSMTPEEVTVQVNVESLPPGRAVPVRAQLQGGLPPEYQVTYSVSPASVVVRQTGSQKPPDLTEVYTEPIALAGHTSSFTQQVALALPPGFTADEQAVTVTVNIGQPWQQRTFADLTLRVDGVSDDLDIQRVLDPATGEVVTTVQVVVAGTQEALSNLDPATLVPFVDATGQGVGETALPIKVTLPPGVSLVRATPDQVHLILGKR